MKKLYPIVMICLLLAGASACKKDKNETTKDKIEGKWHIEKMLTTVYINNEVQEDNAEDDYTDRAFYLQFNANGTGNAQEDGIGSSFNYTISGNDINLSNFKTIGDTDIDAGSQPQKFTIVSSTSTSLVLKNEIRTTVSGYDYHFIATLYLKK